jgi:DedD protein
MAFFKFRKGGDESPAAAPQAESVEVLRRRARHRLIGAGVLVLLGVVGFPLLFDTQPRPVAVDIPIEIPDRNKARPLPAPVSGAPTADARASQPQPVQTARSEPAAPAARPVASGTVSAAPEPVQPKTEPASATAQNAARPAPAASKPQPIQQPVQQPVQQAKAKPEPEPAPKPAASGDAARAKALLEDKSAQAGAPDAAEGRFVVQVGAFADGAKARETRQKVEKAGLKTYTHVAETKEGKRIRVRVGPFATRAEADKAAGRIKELELPAAILTL